tara:strand:+ start:780 stop:1046 length:267 start_codon:yes stop_codon:yes gene_type:complete
MVYRPKKHDWYVLMFVGLVALGFGLEMSVDVDPGRTIGLAIGISDFPCQQYIDECGVGAKPNDLLRCERVKDACRDTAEVEPPSDIGT